MIDKEEIRRKGLETGFDVIGFAPPETNQRDRDRLREFILNREYGDMSWMARNVSLRMDPVHLWPEVRTVIVAGMNYAPPGYWPVETELVDRGRISVYALNRDYHDVMKKRLKKLAGWLVTRFGNEVKIFVDTAPVLEKAIASKSGIGWQGKHTNLVSRRFGSWLFIGEIYTTLEILPDIPEKNRCGSCDRCIRACPTSAIVEPYRMDPRRCISYLTIEHKATIPRELRSAMGTRIYGCDACLAACPWNRFAPASAEPAFHPRKDLVNPALTDLLEFDNKSFRIFFSGSPIKRIGHERFLRNILTGIGNIGNNADMSRIRRFLSADSELVRDSAARAIEQLLNNEKEFA